MILILIVLYAGVVLFHWVPLVKEKNKKAAWVSAVLTVASFAVLLLSLLDVRLPGPRGPIEFIIHSIFPFTNEG